MPFTAFHTSAQSSEQTSAAMHVRALPPVIHLQIQSVFTSEYKQTFWDSLAFRVKVKLEMSQQFTYHDLHLCKGKLLTNAVPGIEAYLIQEQSIPMNQWHTDCTGNKT